MKTSHRKFIKVTCNEPLKSKVDLFLKEEYNQWKANIKNNNIGRNRIISNNNIRDSRVHNPEREAYKKENELLKNYIKYIYEQYSIEDPLADEKQNSMSRTHSQAVFKNNQHMKYKNQEVVQSQMMQVKKLEPKTIGKKSAYYHDIQDTNQYQESGFLRNIPKKDNYLRTQHTQELTNSARRSYSHHKSHSHLNASNRLSNVPTSRKLNFNSFQSYLSSQQNNLSSRRQDEMLGKSKTMRKLPNIKIQDSFCDIVEESNLEDVNQGLKYIPTTPQGRKQGVTRYGYEKIPVKQSYRYCIACEEAILSCNIDFHENRCQKFPQLFSKDILGILDHIEKKIGAINSKINEISFHSLSVEDVEQIKLAGSELGKQSSQVMKNGLMTARFTKNYDSIIKVSKKWSTLAEQVNKVRWFLKIREVIKKDYNI